VGNCSSSEQETRVHAHAECWLFREIFYCLLTVPFQHPSDDGYLSSMTMNDTTAPLQANFVSNCLFVLFMIYIAIYLHV